MELALTAIVVAGIVFGIWDCISRYQAVNEVAAKSDIEVVHKDLKADLAEIKTDLPWIKKFLFGVGVAVLVAALKYILIG